MQDAMLGTVFGVRRSLAHRLPFFYGWIIVAAAFLGSFAGGGLQSFTFGVYIKPMGESLHWSRGAMTFGLTVSSLTASMLGPVFGPLVDKYGPQRMLIVASFLGGCAALLLTQVRELWQFYIVFALVGTAGAAGFGGIVSQATVSKWFIRLRGRATAFATMGNTAAGTFLAPTIAFAIALYDWRAGWVVTALVFFTLLLPVSFLTARQPEDLGLLPDGAKTQDEVKATFHRRRGRESEYSWRLHEALRTKALWMLALALVISGLSVSAVVVHEYSYVRDRGFSPAIASFVLSTHAISASVARVLWGLLVERFHVRYCMFFMYIGCTIGLGILLFANSVPMVYLFAVVYGLNVGGSATLGNVVWANYFGRDFVGTIRGALNPFTSGITAFGPFLAGVGFDRMGGYTQVFIVLMSLFTVGAFVFLVARPPVRRLPPAPAPPTDTPRA